ncbi:MAG: DoxX family protein, partial [Balneolaceae bacterium]
RHYSIELLRIFLGVILTYKGYFFVDNISDFYLMIEEDLQLNSFIVAHYVVAAHLVGGLMLTLGLITRLAALLQIPVLAGAVFYVHARNIFLAGETELEYSILVLILLTVFFFYGGGKWSLDHHIIRQKEKNNS